jgi:hypothetical protein
MGKYGNLVASRKTSKTFIRFLKASYVVNNEIFHYTDIDGLKGILESRGFWLSEARFLNDTEEIYNGVKTTKDLIEELLRKPRYSIFSNVLTDALTELQKLDFRDHYVASFSLKQDDLEQWRAYAKNGSGICVGFNPKIQTSYPHFMATNLWDLVKVIYDDRLKVRILHSIIAIYFFEYKKDLLANRIAVTGNIGYINNLVYSLSSVFILFKNKAFASEEEVRLVYNYHRSWVFDKKNYRNVNGVLVPYFCTSDAMPNKEMVVDLLPVSKIIIGPTNKEVAIESVKYFVQDMGYSADIVEPSSIPYRG